VIVHAERQIYARNGDFLYKMQHHSKIMPGAGLLDDLAAWAQPREARRARGELFRQQKPMRTQAGRD
jgi:hypothetical protein